MPDVSRDTIRRLWTETRDYSWESLRRGLDEIYRLDIISDDTYDRLEWAIGKLENLRIDFPTSASELESRINYYL